MREEFKEKLRNTDSPLIPATLQYSFRSAKPVLEMVDAVFDGQAEAGFTSDGNHIAFHEAMPGRVDVWPIIETKKANKRGKAEDRGEFVETTDKLAEDHHHVLLARRIASEIQRMIGQGDYAPSALHDRNGPRPVTAGDVLILVQQRGTLFEEIIRACKALDLPIAGADRLKVAAELAVRDIRALLSFLATPEDDYSLAVALKSPLFGWSEKQLFDLAHPRPRFLWEHLRKQTERYPDEIAVLRDLRDRADFLRPYDLIERILTRHSGRQNMIGRLGAEAEDGLDALLSQALAYERSQTPSLTGFLTWMETDDLTIKRQMALVRDEIRVMTVHGAKGLEAPIVILPDTAKKTSRKRGSVLGLSEQLVWNSAKDAAPAVTRQRQDEIAAREAEERMRLLYVAMTRAESWLILAASGEVGDDPEDSWYSAIRSAALARAAQDFEFPFGTGLRIERPKAEWDGIAAMLLPGLPDRAELVREAAQVMGAPDLAFLFAQGTLSEVGVSAPIPELTNRTINGVIDRLVPASSAGDPIWIIDYKTNAIVPETADQCPEGVLRQMGAYRSALAQIYPDTLIRTAIVWTHTATLMELPDAATSTALHRAGAELSIDAARPHT